MCHETTSVGLLDSIGLGKGTVTLEDFDLADAIFSFGHNPGTNHPRMLGTLREVSKRGGNIIAINPLKSEVSNVSKTRKHRLKWWPMAVRQLVAIISSLKLAATMHWC